MQTALNKDPKKLVMYHGNGRKFFTEDLLIIWPKKGQVTRDNWFTDSIIDFYFWALNEREKLKKQPKCYFFPVFFFRLPDAKRSQELSLQ